MAPAGPSPPRPAAGTRDRPHILGPGAGSPRQPGSTSFWSGVCACAGRRRGKLGGAAGRARPGRRGPRGDGRGRLHLGRRAHSARPGALAHAHCVARTLPNPRRGLAAAPCGRRAGRGCGRGGAGHPRVLVSRDPACNLRLVSVRDPEPSDEARL